jgi:PAP2 superfamily
LVDRVAVCEVAAVGFSRLYLGVHWLTAVLAGWLLAARVADLAVHQPAAVRPCTARSWLATIAPSAADPLDIIKTTAGSRWVTGEHDESVRR